MTATVLVELPSSLSQLAGCARRLELAVPGEVTQRGILDALELRYPMLRGTIRDQASKARRPFIRFFACETDLSRDLADATVPAAVAAGTEPFQIVAAIAGG